MSPGGEKMYHSLPKPPEPHLPQFDRFFAGVTVLPSKEKSRKARPVFPVANPSLGIVPDKITEKKTKRGHEFTI